MISKDSKDPSTIVCWLLAALFALPATAQDELVIWHAYRGGEKDAFEKVVADFNTAKAAKGIKATTLAVPYDAFADKITAAVPRGRGPDVFIFAQDRMGGWAENKTIEPLDFYVDDKIKNRFIPATFEGMTYQGTVYALPLNFKVLTLFYNKKLIQKPPQTTGELVAMAKKLTDPAAGKFGLAYWYSDFYYHSGLMNAFGGGVFGEGRKPTANLPANAKSMELMLKWLKDDKIIPAEPTVALITNLFNEGRAAMVFSGPWFLGEIAKDVDFGLARLPKVDEAGGQPIKPWMTIEGVYISEPSKKKDAAWEFLDYVTDLQAATILALEGRQTPANKAVYDNPKVGGDAVLKAFRDQVESAVPMPNYAEMSMMWSPMTTAMSKVVKGAATPQVALDEAQKELVERIASLRK